jgi:preprotein translocase subunit YajC
MKILPFFLLPALLCAQEAESSQQSMWPTLMMVGIAMVFFYFILWRPEQKRRKAADRMRSQMKAGDRVTAMGIVAKVSKINEGNTVVLENVDGSKIEVLKAAISEVHAS